MFTDAHRGRGISRFMCTYELALSFHVFSFYIDIYRHCFILLSLLLSLLLNVIAAGSFLSKIQKFRKKRNRRRVLSGLKQFLANESPLKMKKNAFYFTSEAFFVLRIFKFLPLLFGYVSKSLD